jgi:protein arginine kinase
MGLNNSPDNSMFPEILPWLSETAPDTDIVISCRARLARNLVRYPFPHRASEEALRTAAEMLTPALQARGLGAGGLFPLNSLSIAERAQLVGARVISPAFWEDKQHRWIFTSAAWDTVALLNEEDHLRLQITRAGWQPHPLTRELHGWDDYLKNLERGGVRWARLPSVGYLTASPVNLGHGLRLGLLMHLVGLQRTRRIARWLEALQALQCTTRGLYGEGSMAFEGYVQISMLGQGEPYEQLLASLHGTISEVIKAEREAREEMNRDEIEAERTELLTTLQYAESLSLGTTLRTLAIHRLGAILNEDYETCRHLDQLLFSLAVYPPPEPPSVAVERAQWLRSRL